MPRRPVQCALLLCSLAASCLPNDTRPPPGIIHVTVSPDDALAGGIAASSTADGWSITFDKVLVAVGHTSVEGDECIGYSDPDYARVLNPLRGAGQKVSEIYAIGTCEFDWELSSPHDDSLLGVGVTEDDKAFMRTPAGDPWVRDGGVSIYVEGRAAQGGREKRFMWAYRNRVDYSTCHATVSGHRVEGVKVDEQHEQTVELLVSGTALFRTRLDDKSAELGFEDYAAADDTYGDANGEVTLEELNRVPLADVASETRYADAKKSWTSLGDYLVLGLFERMIRYRGNGECELEVFPNDRTPR